MPNRILIIGAVAAGLKAAAKARRSDRNAEITVVEKGELISYGACGLPYYVGGEVNSLDSLRKTAAGMLRDPEYFRNIKNIKVLTRTLATAIDRKARKVTVKDLASGAETALPYDKLVIATGSSPVKPALPGIALDNIYNIWHPDDAAAIRSGLETGKYRNAVIIGAGLIGLEMAAAFANWGISVSMIEMQGHIFPAGVDAEIAGIAEKYLAEEGIDLFTGEKVVAFIGEGAVSSVQTDRRTIPADLVLLGIGARPNVELAKAAGIEIGPSGAIAVNEMLQTSDPDIFAGGDCAECTNIITERRVFAPMGSTANKHGRVIGQNLAGGSEKFSGILGTVIVKIMDMNLGKTGLTEREAKELGYEYITVITAGHDKLHYMEGSKFIALKLLADAKTHKVLGLQAVGEGDIAKRIDVAAAVITLGGTVEDLSGLDLSYAPPFNAPIDNLAVTANVLLNKIAGRFKGLPSADVKELMKDGKAMVLDVRTPDEVKRQRLAGPGEIRYIPLDELRERCSELRKGDRIVTLCKVSLRGYEAAGILEESGFDNVNVTEGGIYSWPFDTDKG